MINRLIHRSGSSESETVDDAPAYPGDVEATDGSENADLLYNKNGKLMYADCLVLWLRFVFSQSTENLFPIAQVNGEDVCGEHSTAHVIGYRLDSDDLTGGTKTFTIKMKLKSSGTECNWNGSASCTYRIWFGARAYSDADAAHKLEKSGTCGEGATFTVTVDTDNGTVSIS